MKSTLFGLNWASIFCRARGVDLVVDASQSLGAEPVDLKEAEASTAKTALTNHFFYCFSLFSGYLRSILLEITLS